LDPVVLVIGVKRSVKTLAFLKTDIDVFQISGPECPSKSFFESLDRYLKDRFLPVSANLAGHIRHRHLKDSETNRAGIVPLGGPAGFFFSAL
jgi:hypothetical protein